MQASGLSGGVTVGSPASFKAAGGASDSDLKKRVAALESGFSALSQAQPSTSHDATNQLAHAVQPMQPRLAAPSGRAGSTSTAGTTGIAGSAGSAGTAGMAGTAGTTGSAGIAGTAGSAGTAGLAPVQHVQTDAAVLGNLQNQIEELRRGKADKAGLEALQLRAAAHSAGASLGDSGKQNAVWD